MKLQIALFVLLAAVTTLRADDKIASMQQQLKEQGFYYGDITGEKDADTTAAVRRFQIRNGLQINGELNDETVRALKSGGGSASASKVVTPPPGSTPAASEPRSTPARETVNATPTFTQPNAPAPQGRQAPLLNPGGVSPMTDGLMVGTPYEDAPPDVQRDVIVRAQKTLARKNLFPHEIDGIYGPNLEFSLRAYQSRVGIPATGRLDLGTLAALELLPGADTPVYTPRRGLRPRRDLEPPVRGEWIRP